MANEAFSGWAMRGGRPPNVPPKRRGTVWMVADAALGILSVSTTQHPAIVLSDTPLLVISGSDSHRYDLDAVQETMSNADLELFSIGRGFTGPTVFDVCSPVPVTTLLAFGPYIGELKAVAWQRILDARHHCW